MTFDAIRVEYEQVGIGPLLWELLVDVAGRVARRYPPALYNHGEGWTEEAHRDLALEVATERLLGEGQLEYVLALAEESPADKRDDALAGLLGFQVKRVLSHRRRITVVDRLHTRLLTLIRSDEFTTSAAGGDTVISRTESDSGARPLTEEDVRRGSALIGDIPRIPSRPNAERESKVYTTANLEELVARLVDAFGSVQLSDVRRILELTLTAWVPTLLVPDEEDSASTASPELEMERTRMNALIDSLASSMDAVERQVLAGKSQGMSDGALAERLGRSRPWVADRKVEVLQRVQDELVADLPELLHDEAVRGLLDALADLQEAES